jgi:hypothetical protein
VCDLDTIGTTSMFGLIHSDTSLVRMLPTFDLNCKPRENPKI